MIRHVLISAILFVATYGCNAHGKVSSVRAAPAATASDTAVNQLSLGYYQQVPEAATYNGTPEPLAPGADALSGKRALPDQDLLVAAYARHPVQRQYLPPRHL